MQLIYNNVELVPIKTNSIRREIRLSEDRTEYLWTDVIIDVQCVFSPGMTSYPDDSLAINTDITIRNFLMQPRKPLFLFDGNVQYITIPELPTLPNGDAIDADVGPTPISCTITKLGASRVFFVNYVIKCSIVECGVPLAIASNRYSRSDVLDSQYRSMMTTAGIAVFRSNILAELQADADAFREYIIPAPLVGYRRMNVVVTVATNGMSIEYTIIDREEFVGLGDRTIPGTAAAVGITEMEFNYSTSTLNESSLGAASLMQYARVTAVARGMRDAGTLAMVMFLFRAAQSRFNNIAGGAFLAEATSNEDYMNKIVSVSLAYNIFPQDSDTLGPNLNIPLQAIGTPIYGVGPGVLINPKPPFGNATRGEMAYISSVSAFADACYANITSLSQDNTGLVLPPYAYNVPVDQGIGPQVIAFDPVNTPSQSSTLRRQPTNGNRAIGGLKSIVPSVQNIQSTYHTNSGIINLPIASLPPSSSSSQGQNQGPTSVNIQLFQPRSSKKVEFYIEQFGAVPQVPDPTPNDSGWAGNYTLLTSDLAPVGIEIGADGVTPVYRISGFYTYSYNSYIGNNDTIPFDIPSWVNLDPSEYTEVIDSDYAEGIINNPPV